MKQSINQLKERGIELVSSLINPTPERPKWKYEHYINLDYGIHDGDEIVDDMLEIMLCFKHSVKYEEEGKTKYKVDYTNVDIAFFYIPDKDNYVWRIMDHKHDDINELKLSLI